MHAAEVSRSTAFDDFKHPDEGRKDVNAGDGRNLRNRQLWMDQQIFRITDALPVYVFIKRNIGKVFKEPAEVVFTEAGSFCSLFKSDVFCTVFADIITYSQKFFHIFLVGVITCTGAFEAERLFPSEPHENFDELCMDCSFEHGIAQSIFITDLQQKHPDLLMGSFVAFGSNQHGGRKSS